jgi:hypothetical protein
MGIQRAEQAQAGVLSLAAQPIGDLYAPYGGKIARLEKMLRFMS